MSHWSLQAVEAGMERGPVPVEQILFAIGQMLYDRLNTIADCLTELRDVQRALTAGEPFAPKGDGA
jgi:hypothetical protein